MNFSNEESAHYKVQDQANVIGTQASMSGGEMVINSLPALGGLLPKELAPLKFIWLSVRNFFRGFKILLSRPILLIPVIILAVIWLALTVLNSLGYDNQIIRVLSFLTFAQGGAGGSIVNLLGGIAGKGLFTYLISTTVMSIFGNKRFNFGFGGIKVLFGALRFRKNNSLAPLLLGSGISLIAYNFMAGEISTMSGMAAITGLILSLRALTSQAGFLKGVLRSILFRFSKGSLAAARVNYIIAGLTTGFALSIPLSFLPVGIIGYIVGATLLVLSLVVKIAFGRKKEVAAA